MHGLRKRLLALDTVNTRVGREGELERTVMEDEREVSNPIFHGFIMRKNWSYPRVKQNQIHKQKLLIKKFINVVF